MLLPTGREIPIPKNTPLHNVHYDYTIKATEIKAFFINTAADQQIILLHHLYEM